MRLCHCHRMTGSYDYLAPSLLGHLCTKLKAIRCLSDKQYLSVSGRFCLRVGHESLFQNPIQPNPKFLDPTHKRLHPTQPITQPIIDTWYCILGDTENFIQQLLHVTDKFTVNDSHGGRDRGGQGGHGPSNNLVGGAILYLAPPNILHWNLKF